MFYINRVKKAIVHIRTWTKFAIIIIIAAFVVVGTISFIYRPIYAVTLNGEMIGYSEEKSKLQERIEQYIEKGNGENIAFVDINELPQYSLCLLKKDVTTNDDEIFEKVISTGTTYYQYYAIAVNNQEKKYVSSFQEAEQVVNELKNKNSNNKNQLSIIEKYETELKEFSTVEETVSSLYEKKVVYSSVTVAATGINTSSKKIDLGISLIRPISGTVTSRFGARWGKTHKGLDIGAPKGTVILAAASGTVTTASYGYGGGYGNHVIISHGKGITTLYGHCTDLLVSVGTYVTQGQPIATVGNTGNSQGNHLHLEIRINGVAQNPQNYLY